MAIGTGIALLPERAIASRPATLPADARRRRSLLVLALLLAPGLASAQHVEDPKDARLQVFSKEVKDVTRKLACWCGGCSKLPVGDCACGHCALVKGEVTTMLKEGKTFDAVLAHYVEQEGGNQVLSEPPDQGMGRVAWLLPYAARRRSGCSAPACSRCAGRTAPEDGRPGRDARGRLRPALAPRR